MTKSKQTFSQRVGLEALRTKLQTEDIDAPLRNLLWNSLQLFIWNRFSWSSIGGWLISREYNRGHFILCQRLWNDLFKAPLDTLDTDWRKTSIVLRRHFFAAPWNGVYDFIEFVADAYPDKDVTTRLIAHVNQVLEQELSAYRFVDGLITRVIDQEEIVAIEDATRQPIEGARLHIRRSLELLADRQQPDYRNSIKESISAVEAICRHYTGDGSATLGEALSALKSDSRLHPALRSAFEKLYGYSSDEGGIRHALLDANDVGFDEAKFMLVACSAFVNFMASRFGHSGSDA
jgi:hypothetical protein